MSVEFMRVAVRLEIDPYHLKNKARLNLWHDQCPKGGGSIQTVDYIKESYWYGGLTVRIRCRGCQRSEEFTSDSERWGIESALLAVMNGRAEQEMGMVRLIKKEPHLIAFLGRPRDIVKLPSACMPQKRGMVSICRGRHLRLVWDKDRQAIVPP